MLLWTLTSAAALALAAGPAEPKTLAVPSLPKAPALDGSLKDLPAGAPLKAMDPETGKMAFTGKVAYRKDTLYVVADVPGGKVDVDDPLTVSLHFPNAGATALGYTFQVFPGGVKPPQDTTPAYAAQAVRSAVKPGPKSVVVELALPPLAVPRWPAVEPLVLDLCVSHAAVSNCDEGSMSVPLKVPDDYRKGFKLKFPEKQLDAIERRPGGWVGFGSLHYPRWIEGEQVLTPESLTSLITDHPLDPEAVHVPMPEHMTAPDGRPLLGLVTGENPYAIEDQCAPNAELRLGLFAYQGKVAHRVLEWTAANCSLGRTASISFGNDGGLTIGYSNGATTTFTWTGDHFEQTQLGER